MKYETVMEIDLNKLKNNTRSLVKCYSDYKYKIVDLKDNAHGLGLEVVDTFEANGINCCMVGSVKDAIKIRQFNKSIEILVNYYVTLDEVYDCINNNITITIYSLDYLMNINELKLKDTIKVQILIDNGSNLMGIKDSLELSKVLDIINNNKYIELTGIYGEITTLGVKDEYYYKQVDKFYNIISKYISKDLMIHLNEPIMYHKKRKYINGIRFDLSIIGIEENICDDLVTNMKIKSIEKKYKDLEFPNINLELVFSITSEIMDIRSVSKSTIVGRGYVAKEDLMVAILPIGHKDGITKAIKYVTINNKKCDILTDEIDRLVVKVTNLEKIKDKVYILNEERDIYEFINLLNTNRYYLMSILNRNLARIYTKKEENLKNIL